MKAKTRELRWFDANSFTETDWKEMTNLCRSLLKEKVFDGHQGKCWIAAYIIWLGTQPDIKHNGLTVEDTRLN